MGFDDGVHMSIDNGIYSESKLKLIHHKCMDLSLRLEYPIFEFAFAKNYTHIHTPSFKSNVILRIL